MEKRQKTVFITGGGSGIGFGIARCFYRQGYHVIIVGRSNRVITAAKKLGPNAKAWQVDISKKTNVENIFEMLKQQQIQVDVLVNNAGISHLCRFLDVTDEILQDHYETNVLGCIYCTQAVLPQMIEQQWGRIIMISSVTGPFVADPGDCAYAMTKAALLGITKSLAIEFAPYQITVNAICPGYVRTPMSIGSASVSARNDTEDILQSIAAEVPLKRLGTPEEIGELAVFLASSGAAYITGQSIICDGGHSVSETSVMGMT